MKKAVSEDNIRDPNKGGTVDLDGVKVTLTHAQHSSSTIDDDHMVYLGEPVGSCSRSRTARRSTSPATRTSSATCS
jgi:L-ascorbate metabolism protein UlaG (beta-lactamase superfamily)